MNKSVIVAVLAVSGLMLGTGCRDKKSPPPPAQTNAELAPVNPQPYIPPSGGSVTVTPGAGETTSAAPVVAPVPDVAPREAAPAPKKSTPAASSSGSSVRPGGTYTVKRGDTLSEIAQRAYGSASKRNIDAIRRANGIKGDTIRIGQKLKIPASTSGSSRSGGNKD